MSAIIGALRVVLGIDTSAYSAGLADAQKSLSSVGKKMQDVGKSLALSVSAPLAGFGGLAIKVSGDFEAAMNRVGAATGATAKEMADLQSIAERLGIETKFSAVEAAEGIEILAKNGLAASDILGGALESSLLLAASSGADLASAADLATDVMLNFNKTAGDLGGVVDGVTGVLLASKFGFDDYRLALAQAGGVAGGLGVDLEEFNAAIAATSSAFASGSDAGTSFKTFLQTLVPKSADAQGAMLELGLEFFDAAGNMKPMAEIAQELQDGLRGLSDEAKNDALSTIFGTDAMRTAIGLAREGASGIRDITAAIGEASATEQAAARMEGFNGQLEKLKSAFEGLLLAIGNSGLLETFTGLALKLTELVGAIASADPALLKLGVIIGGIGAAVGPVLIGLGLLSAAIGAISLPIVAVVAGIAGLTAALVAFHPEIMAAKDAVIAFGTQALDWIKAKPAEIAETFRAIGAEMREIGVTIFTSLRDGITEGWETIRAAIPVYVQELKDLFHAAVEGMRQIGVDIIAGLWSGISEKWESVKSGITGFASSIGGIFRKETQTQSPSKVMAAVGSDIMAGLGVGFKSQQEGIQSELQSFAGSIAGTLEGIITGATTFKDGFRDLMAQTFSSIGSSMINQGLSGLLGGKIPGFAAGTNFAPGGLAMVGERGPELVSLPRGSKVTPNHRMGNLAPVFNINVNGARGNSEIREMVSAGVAQGMNQVRREVPGIIGETNKRRG